MYKQFHVDFVIDNEISKWLVYQGVYLGSSKVLPWAVRLLSEGVLFKVAINKCVVVVVAGCESWSYEQFCWCQKRVEKREKRIQEISCWRIISVNSLFFSLTFIPNFISCKQLNTIFYLIFVGRAKNMVIVPLKGGCTLFKKGVFYVWH